MGPHHLSRRATYSPFALQKYLEHISLPLSHRSTLLHNAPRHAYPTGVKSTEWGTSSDGLRELRVLQKYQQARIPFANLYLHYSPYHVGTLEPEGLWRYLIDSETIVSSSTLFARAQAHLDGGKRSAILNEDFRTPEARGLTERERKWEGRRASGGRGGSCTLNNGFFGTVMRSLGMKVKTTGARVAMGFNGAQEVIYGGWNHLVNLVDVEGKTFLVDVGFGGNGPTEPLELKDGYEMPWGSTPNLVRLIHAPVPEFTDPTSKVWIFQHKRVSQDWKDVYIFTETEFLPQDTKVMNYSTTFDVRGSFFNHMVICTKTVMENESVVGTLSLVNGMIKRRTYNTSGELRSEIVAELRNEVDRWEALEEWFGITLGEGERAGIRGLVTELKMKAEED